MTKNSTILVLRVWYTSGMFGLMARVEWNKLVNFVKKWMLLRSILFHFIPIHSIQLYTTIPDISQYNVTYSVHTCTCFHFTHHCNVSHHICDVVIHLI